MKKERILLTKDTISHSFAIVIPILFFAAFLIYGLCVYKHYGISWDEPIERDSSLITYEYTHPVIKDWVTETVNFKELPDFEDYHYRYYGTAIQQPLVWAESHNGFQMSYHDIYEMRHLYVFLLFWLASIIFYLLCKYFFNSWRWALLGVVFLIISPRILADSFYNIKDLVGLSLYLIAAYFGVKMIEHPMWWNMILFAFIGALCTNARIVGAIVIASCLIVLILRGFADKTWRKYLVYAFLEGVLSLGFYVMITPITWVNPVKGIIDTIKTFSDYGGYEGPILFMGQYYRPSDIPFYYLPLWIIMTTPLFLQLLLGTGLVFQVKNMYIRVIRKIKFEGVTWNKLFLLLCMIIPVIYVVLFSPTLYNGWRHFYFIYPFMAFFALLGCRELLGKFLNLKWWKWISAGSIGGAILITMFWIIKNHPFEYIYFNPIARNFVEGSFEKDYWGVSEYAALKNIAMYDTRDHIKVWCSEETSMCVWRLNESDQRRVEIVEDPSEADYLIHLYVGDTNERFERQHMFQRLRDITVDDIVLCSIFEREQQRVISSQFVNGGKYGSKAYLSGSIQWIYHKDEEKDIWTGLLKQPVTADMVWTKLESESSFAYDEIMVEVADNAENWYKINNETYYPQLFDERKIEMLRISLPSTAQYDITIELYSSRLEDEEISESDVITAQASDNTAAAYFAIDNDEDTYWTTDRIQKRGMFFESVLRREQILTAVELTLGNSTWDYPRNLQLEVSCDGKNWTKVHAVTQDNQLYILEPVKAQFIRLVLGNTEETMSFWRIHEMKLYISGDE